MEQQSIIPCLTRKGLATMVVYEDLVATLGTGAISYPLVIPCLRELKFAASNPEVTFSEPIREHGDCDQAVLLAFYE
jgi:hypothetical protein